MNKILRYSFIAVMALVCGTMSAQTELLENGGFETWKDGVATNWQSSNSASSAKVSQSTDARTGESAILVKSDAKSNKRLAYKELNLKAGTYKMSFYAKGGQVRPGYAISVNGSIDGKEGYKYGSYAVLSATEWKLVENEFILEASTTINLLVMNPKTNKSYTATDAIIDDFSLTTTDGGIDGTVAPPADITNTPETAYTVAKAKELIDAGKGLATPVYVKGKVSQASEKLNEKYGSLSYYISDDGTTNNELQVYGGLSFKGEKFTSVDDIKVGDEVVVYGQLKMYNETYEIDKNNILISKNGATGINKVVTDVDSADAPVYNLSGQCVGKNAKGVLIKNGKKYVVK